MSTVEEIELAIEQLSQDEVTRLTRWLIERDNARWDKEMEHDAASGKLDFLFREAAEERNRGELQDWPPPST